LGRAESFPESAGVGEDSAMYGIRLMEQCLNTARPAGQAARCCCCCQPSSRPNCSHRVQQALARIKIKQGKQKEVRRDEKLKEHRNKRGLKKEPR